MITEIEQNTLDIDWFFTNGNEVGFVTSAGGKLPGSVAAKSLEEIELLAAYFKSLPINSGANINPNLKRLIGHVTDWYLSSFTEMTERGLFSFDKTITNSFSDTNYFLVAKPINPLKFNELPKEIAEILVKTFIKGSVQENLDIGPFI